MWGGGLLDPPHFHNKPIHIALLISTTQQQMSFTNAVPSGAAFAYLSELFVIIVLNLYYSRKMCTVVNCFYFIRK